MKSNWRFSNKSFYKSFIIRFIEKIRINDITDCWEWIGGKNDDGYGNFYVKGKGILKAHKISYIIHIGDIPEGMCVCHHCDNPSCVNPYHLFLGTRKDNMQDMSEKKRYVVPKLKGEKCGASKLSDKQVEEMRKIYSEIKISTRKLGELFGISQPQACRIVNYKSR